MQNFRTGEKCGLKAGEEESLLLALKDTPTVRWMVIFALETAMRRGEIIGIKWKHFNHRQRLLNIPITKTDQPRTIPLTSIAQNVLNNTPIDTDGTIFKIKADSVTQAFSRACRRGKLTDLHFHDLRHEATSRLFERGLTMMEVASITGHKDLKMLQRYTHLRPEDILKKLD